MRQETTLDFNVDQKKAIDPLSFFDGAALVYELDITAAKFALDISYVIASTPAFKELAKRLPSPRLILYFQFIIRHQIYPFVRQGCIIRRHKASGKPFPSSEAVIKVPNSCIFQILKDFWSFKDSSIKLVNPLSFEMMLDPLLYKFTEVNIKNYIKTIINKFHITGRNKFNIKDLQNSNIACHHVEGIDPLDRSDLNWFDKNNIPPNKVLVYFDEVYSKTSKPIEYKVIKELEENGFKWVALKKGIIENQKSNYWQAPKPAKSLFQRNDMAKDSIDKWVLQVGNDLLRGVYYWRAFYDEFNIKINYVPEEVAAKNIVQAIAFDIQSDKPGVLISKQRSEIFQPSIYWLSYHPKHIFFMRSKRSASYLLNPHYEYMEKIVISGYPYNRSKNNINARYINIYQRLKSNGARFIVTIFDTGYGGAPTKFPKKGDGQFYQLGTCSKESITEFLMAFLQWVLDDPDVGLIIKPKKDRMMDNLHSIKDLLNRAFATGRCVRIEDAMGKFPADAAFDADIAVGCGISTAISEVVITSDKCKGIHYDITNIKNHEFYKWGYERLIFNNLERLLAALKRYKEDPTSQPGLGDWSAHLDELDPFRDGKGGQRIGEYMCWLLESFDASKNREEAIRYANERYTKQWGEDKVINIINKKGGF